MGRRIFAMWACAVLCTGRAIAAEAPTGPQEVLAGPPDDLSVTVYRSSLRNEGSIDLDDLRGFALIRESRLLQLPAGLSRVRFEGVADGIEPVSAILGGLSRGVIEKNLDAQLLSPAALVAAAAGKTVILVRTNKERGTVEQVQGTIISGPEADGVVFRTPEGIEALQCSGLPETFDFADSTGLSATPTLSVLVRTTHALAARVELSYLAYGFDWAADYTAVLSGDGKTVDLGAWVTLANGNDLGFPAARTQVVAGRLNRESEERGPLAHGGKILAQCWPRGSTSDQVAILAMGGATPLAYAALRLQRDAAAPASALGMIQEVTVTGSRVSQEQLGDLKLYRVPGRTTVASHQSKQVRLLDRAAIPVRKIYSAQLAESAPDEASDGEWSPASMLLRTRNDLADHLGLPLPSGHVAVFQNGREARLLLSESDVRDLAVDEEVEIDTGHSSDVQVRTTLEARSIDAARVSHIPLLPGVLSMRHHVEDLARHVEISNASQTPIDFELRIKLHDGGEVVRADHPMGMKDGAPIFRLSIPAQHAASVRFQTAHAVDRLVVPR